MKITKEKFIGLLNNTNKHIIFIENVVEGGLNLDLASMLEQEGYENDLSSLNLYNFNLSGCNFKGIRLAHINFYNSNLFGSVLEGCDLSYTNFHSANLSCSVLTSTNMQNSNLLYANLSYAILYNSNLKDANFLSCDLEGAFGITRINIETCKSLKLEEKSWVDKTCDTYPSSITFPNH